MLDFPLWPLLLAQIAMGGFDTLYHHELTQRLAWKPRAALELKLHGVRNLIYAVVFLALGWSAPTGGWATALLALLLTEAGITLWDFVEEDRTRLLPASERVTHTLLTLNYGVVLALLVPDLWSRAARADALPLVWNGWLSVIFAAAAAGVVLFGLRDMAAAARIRRIVETDAAPLLGSSARRRNILVTGGTGFVGRRLVAALAGAGHSVTVLTRDRKRALELPAPVRVVTDLVQIHAAERIHAIVNLAGESVAGGLWTGRRRAEIKGSRVRMAAALDALVGRLQCAPEVLVAASAVGFYGDTGEAVLDEGGAAGTCFSADACRAAEDAAEACVARGMRVVRLRIGMVLASEGGLLGNLLFPFEMGMGGPIGSGRQWMSWIHRDDLVRLIAFAIEDESLGGAVNAVAPNPVRNRAFAQALGKALHRPALIPLPAAPLRWLLGDFARELFLAGQRALPVKAVFHGFQFLHPEIGDALGRIVGAPKPAATAEPAWREARLLH
ncbi:TIGR01777 family protein [Sphingomonas sp. JC676]|uniref:TIGR01777 family oxidoreductase n=1 Tax=Sphingomonas sp. JC676 TaxID=2768065 RepID=UPI00165848A8|nr:TIGR01777 family oxidoreductase [Sphingomonas sp. JC676]MBC9032713.1 TIGR01777 family protein [Sphingomonas sp. JC676]